MQNEIKSNVTLTLGGSENLCHTVSFRREFDCALLFCWFRLWFINEVPVLFNHFVLCLCYTARCVHINNQQPINLVSSCSGYLNSQYKVFFSFVNFDYRKSILTSQKKHTITNHPAEVFSITMHTHKEKKCRCNQFKGRSLHRDRRMFYLTYTNEIILFTILKY